MTKSFLHIILFIFLWSSCNEATQPLISKTAAIEFKAIIDIPKKNIYAGEDIKGKIILDKPNTAKEFFLLVHTPFGSYNYSIIPNQNTNSFLIPGKDTKIAGKRDVALYYEGNLIAEHELYIHAGAAKDKLDSFSGPKTLFVADDDGTMLVNIPHDKYGNPIEDMVDITYNINFDGAQSSKVQKSIDHLISYQITNAGSEKGKYLIGVQSEQSYSGEQEIIIEPGMPANLKIELVRVHPYADARQFVHIKTNVLKDQFNNIVSDGTIVNFVVESKGVLKNIYQSFTVSGIANVYIENPSQAETWDILASIYGSVESDRISINFEKYVKPFIIKKIPDHNMFKIGPVFGNLNQLVPDGTEANISIQGSTFSQNIFLDQGQAVFIIPFQWQTQSSDYLDVLIGGVTQSIRVDGAE